MQLSSNHYYPDLKNNIVSVANARSANNLYLETSNQ
nr:MAG TPA: hypothetical protein [Caudoviricetes sp.]